MKITLLELLEQKFINKLDYELVLFNNDSKAREQFLNEYNTIKSVDDKVTYLEPYCAIYWDAVCYKYQGDILNGLREIYPSYIGTERFQNIFDKAMDDIVNQSILNIVDDMNKDLAKQIEEARSEKTEPQEQENKEKAKDFEI